MRTMYIILLTQMYGVRYIRHTEYAIRAIMAKSRMKERRSMEDIMLETEEKTVESLVSTVKELPGTEQLKLLYIAQGMRIASDLKNGGEGLCSLKK